MSTIKANDSISNSRVKFPISILIKVKPNKQYPWDTLHSDKSYNRGFKPFFKGYIQPSTSTLQREGYIEEGVPEAPFMDATYFYREPNQVFTVANFHNTINFGTVDNNIEGCLLAVMQNLYAPVYFGATHWPDSVKNDFGHKLHMFLAKLTDQHHKLFGLTVLCIPQESSNLQIEVASKDKELVKRLEGIVVYWTKQVGVGLQDQDQTTPEDLLVPTDEIQFWKYRYKNLRGLSYQLENKGLKQVCDILIAVQSTYVRQFLVLVDEIKHNVEEAKSNIEFLQVLREPCMLLNDADDPSKIPENIPNILHLVRFIWLKSPFYNTPDKITLLYRAISNQIIIQCTDGRCVRGEGYTEGYRYVQYVH